MNRVRIIIHGAVQGVGFRPFVYRLASEMGLKGWVLNSSQGVFIEVEGCKEILDSFIFKIEKEKPRLSFIQSMEFSFLDPAGYDKFEIRLSKDEGNKTVLVMPDIATCDDCLSDIFDPNNRRYLYPFTNCTNCGPRFSLVERLPYDRHNTTMKKFECVINAGKNMRILRIEDSTLSQTHALFADLIWNYGIHQVMLFQHYSMLCFKQLMKSV